MVLSTSKFYFWCTVLHADERRYFRIKIIVELFEKKQTYNQEELLWRQKKKKRQLPQISEINYSKEVVKKEIKEDFVEYIAHEL